MRSPVHILQLVPNNVVPLGTVAGWWWLVVVSLCCAINKHFPVSARFSLQFLTGRKQWEWRLSPRLGHAQGYPPLYYSTRPCPETPRCAHDPKCNLIIILLSSHYLCFLYTRLKSDFTKFVFIASGHGHQGRAETRTGWLDGVWARIVTSSTFFQGHLPKWRAVEGGRMVNGVWTNSEMGQAVIDRHQWKEDKGWEPMEKETSSQPEPVQETWMNEHIWSGNKFVNGFPFLVSILLWGWRE